jgi:hypothetical protein
MRTRNGKEPPLCAILKAIHLGGEGAFGPELRLLYGLLAHCDQKQHDPHEPLAFRMTLQELASLAQASKASAGRWRQKLRESGHLQYDDPSGKKMSTDYVFHCKVCPPKSALPLVSQSETLSPPVSQSELPVSQSEPPVSQSELPLERTRVSPDPTTEPTPEPAAACARGASGFNVDVQQALFDKYGVAPLFDDPKMAGALSAAYQSGVCLDDVLAACAELQAGSNGMTKSIRRFLPAIKQVKGRVNTSDKYDRNTPEYKRAMREMGMDV